MPLSVRSLSLGLSAALLFTAAAPAGDPVPAPARLGRPREAPRAAHVVNLRSIAFAPDGKQIAWVFARSDRNDKEGFVAKGSLVIHVWDLEKKLPVENLLPKDNLTWASSPLRFTPDGDQILLGTWEVETEFDEDGLPVTKFRNQVRNWNVRREAELEELPRARGSGDTAPRDIVINDKGDRVTSLSRLSVTVVEYPSGEEVHKHEFKPAVSAPVLSADGGLFAGTPGKFEFRVWKTAGGKEVARGRGIPVAFAPGGKILAVQGGGKVDLWDLAAGKAVRSFAGNVSAADAATPLCFSADGKRLAWNEGAKVVIADAGSGKVLARLEGRPGPLAFSPDGNTLALAAPEGHALLWDLRKLK